MRNSFETIMRFSVFSVFWGIFYAATVSATYVNFINEDRVMFCEGEGVKWFYSHSNQLLPNSSSKYLIEDVGGNKSKLTVMKIDFNDNGNFTCRSASSEPRVFELKTFLPLSIDSLTNPVVVRENGTAVLRCKSMSAPNATVEWFFDDVKLESSDDVDIFNGGIKLSNVKAEQAGVYSCVVTQTFRRFKNVQEKKMQLVIEYAPKSQGDKVQSLNIALGKSTILQCDIDGVPTPKIRWTRNGFEVYDDVSTFNSNSQLEVELKTAESFANYSCLAFNYHGDETVVFVITESKILSSPIRSKASTTSNSALFVAVVFFATIMFD